MLDGERGRFHEMDTAMEGSAEDIKKARELNKGWNEFFKATRLEAKYQLINQAIRDGKIPLGEQREIRQDISWAEQALKREEQENDQRRINAEEDGIKLPPGSLKVRSDLSEIRNVEFHFNEMILKYDLAELTDEEADGVLAHHLDNNFPLWYRARSPEEKQRKRDLYMQEGKNLKIGTEQLNRLVDLNFSETPDV